MNAPKVDVLAVMRKFEGVTCGVMERLESEEARAAVAELIEAAKAVNEWYAARNIGNSSVRALLDAQAIALARCGAV